MAFQLKDFRSIVASMINHVRGTTDKLTDFNVGAVNRTLLEAPAVEIDELYQQMFHGLLEAIPAALYDTFQFPRLPAVAASTDVRFTASVAPFGSPLVIPAGTIIRAPEGVVGYVTDADASIPVGQTTATVRVVADTVGAVGNAIANTITVIDAPIGNVTVTNPDAIVSGRNQETDAGREQRFKEFIQSLSRAPIVSIEFGAKTAVIKNSSGDIIEFVAQAKVIEPYLTDVLRPLGYIECYIFNGVFAASAALIAETQKTIDGYFDAGGTRIMGWKAAGIVCEVKAVTMVPVTINITLVASAGFVVSDLIKPVSVVARGYVRKLRIAEPLLVAELLCLVMRVQGVHNASVTTPASDITPAVNAKLYVGVLTIS